MAYDIIKKYLQSQGVDTSLEQKYDCCNIELTQSFDQMLEGVLNRLGSEERTVAILMKIEIYLKNNWYRSDKIVDHGIQDEQIAFLQDMGANREFNGDLDATWDKLAQDYEMDIDFLKWWAKERDIADQQMFCDHNSTDMFSTDGIWYNSTGTCIKCLCDEKDMIDYNDEIALVYKAWKAHKP